MGYCTDYKLTTKPRKELSLDDLETMSGGYCWDEDMGHSYSLYDAKWYDHEAHMKKFSKKKDNKDLLFILSGEGEESGDLWQAYYKNGKSVHYQATLTFPEFDEKDLK